MSRLTAILVDDEPKARTLLRNMLAAHCPQVEILGEAENVKDAVQAIHEHQPQIVFLDIEMPRISGLELPSFFKAEDLNFNIIFVTAYSEFAVEAFRLSACDYLLKPVDPEDLQTAVEKAALNVSAQQITERFDSLKVNMDSSSSKRIALPHATGMDFVELNDVVYFQADRSYSDVHLMDGTKFTVSQRLRVYEELLESNMDFFRIHRAYLINMTLVKSYSRPESLMIMKNGESLPISRERKQEVENILANYRA